MKRSPKRLFIYPKDASMITGRSVRSCYYLLGRIRKHLKKLSHQAISIKEFCEYMGIPIDDVLGLLEG